MYSVALWLNWPALRGYLIFTDSYNLTNSISSVQNRLLLFPFYVFILELFLCMIYSFSLCSDNYILINVFLLSRSVTEFLFSIVWWKLLELETETTDAGTTTANVLFTQLAFSLKPKICFFFFICVYILSLSLQAALHKAYRWTYWSSCS